MPALRQLGREIDSINSFQLKGLDNSNLYCQAAKQHDLCFTKDAGFVHNVCQKFGSLQTKGAVSLAPNSRRNSL